VPHSFRFDLLKFSFTHEMAMLLPRSLRLAYKELHCIRKFCKDHPLAHFDRNLLSYLFKFVCSGFEQLCPVPLTTEELKYLARLREPSPQGPPRARNYRMTRKIRDLKEARLSDMEAARPRFSLSSVAEKEAAN
jgi:hypothetical protein